MFTLHIHPHTLLLPAELHSHDRKLIAPLSVRRIRVLAQQRNKLTLSLQRRQCKADVRLGQNKALTSEIDLLRCGVNRTGISISIYMLVDPFVALSTNLSKTLASPTVTKHRISNNLALQNLAGKSNGKAVKAAAAACITFGSFWATTHTTTKLTVQYIPCACALEIVAG